MQQGCPRFLEFLTNCFTDLMEADRLAVIDTIGEWFGAAMVRNKPRELRKALWLFGESRTGKTRIAEVLRLLVGEPVSSIKLRALEKNFGASALIGKRAWIADDAIGSNDEVDDAQFKVIVTGEAFSVDVKNRDHATLRLEIPVLLTSNSLPRVRDQSDAVYNRSILAHLRVVRTEEETAGTVPIEEIVREHELSGVFSWALDGWARLWKRGRFSPPASMREAATEFKAANNVVDSWAKESLAAASEYMIDRRDAYASFKGWYIAEFGENAKVPSPKFMMMTLRQCMTIGDHKQVGNRYITGIKMTDDGLIYRKESGHEVGITPGSGCDPKEVNRPVPYEAAAQEKPSYQTAKGKEPRF
jgi:P4 family phage/plasmid primase-like protien